MSPRSSARPQHAHRRSQFGAVSILGIFVMLMGLSALGVLGVGQSVWEKGRLQSIVDQMAVTAARQMNDAPGFASAFELGRQNGLLPTDTISLQCLINGAVTANCANAVAVRATITRSVRPFFLGPARNFTAVAEATNAPVVAAMISSNLATLDTNKSALLNGLLSTLGGGAVNLSVADYKGLLGADVQVNLVDLALNLGVANLNELVGVNLTALQLLNEGLALGRGNSSDMSRFQGALGLAGSALNRVQFKLGDILALDLDPGTVNAKSQFANINLGELAQAALLRSVQDKSYTLKIAQGLLGLDVGVTILQPPQIFVGRKLPNKFPIAQGQTAQIALDVRAKQTVNLIVASVGVDIGILLKVAGGVAQVDDLTCHIPRDNNLTTLTVQPALLDLCIAQSASNLKSKVGGLTCGPPAKVAEVTLLGIPIGVKLGASATLRPNPVSIELEGAAPPTIRHAPIALNVSQTLANLLGGINLNPQLDVPLVGGLLNLLLAPLLNTLLGALQPVLSPILGIVGGILDGVLALLGLSLNEVSPSLLSVDCSSALITR